MTLARAIQPDDDGDARRSALDESFVQFIEENYAKLVKFLLRNCFDQYLAEDALHEALIVAMDKWAVVSGHEQPLYWVRKTAWHKLLTLHGRQNWKDHVPLESAPRDIAEPVGSHERETLLRLILSLLPFRQRAVLSLVAEGDSDERIGEQLGLALTTVRTYKCEARETYRELLRAGGDPA